jgi:hypothetical protein
VERDRQLVRAAEQAKRAEAERKAVADATVAIWKCVRLADVLYGSIRRLGLP